MANQNLNENCGVALLSTTTVADMQSDTPTLNPLYTCPTGKRAIITMVVIRDPSASLAGMDDVDFGVGATAAVQAFLNNVADIADMTATTDYMILRQGGDDPGVTAPDEYTIIDGDDATTANRIFSMYVVSGSTGAASAVIDVFGYLFDS